MVAWRGGVAWQVAALRAALRCGLRPIVRLGQRSRGYRYYADTASGGFRSYKQLGARYAVRCRMCAAVSTGMCYVYNTVVFCSRK